MMQKENFLNIIRETPILIKITRSYQPTQANIIRTKIQKILKELAETYSTLGAIGAIDKEYHLVIGILESNSAKNMVVIYTYSDDTAYRDWETDRKSTRLNSSHSAKSRMPSSA